MGERYELKIKNSKNPYPEIVQSLFPHKEKPPLSVEFIVEGNLMNPIVVIRYPGRRVKKRKLKKPTRKSVDWENLFDFAVIPYVNKKETKIEDFTYEKLLEDFEKNKKDSDEFWKCVEEIYYHNTLSKEPPSLPGINSKLFLLVLKWLWIQEDLNYKLDWKDVGSPIPYIRVTKTGRRIGKRAGRAKFFAALVLIRYGFKLEEVKSIIPLYA